MSITRIRNDPNWKQQVRHAVDRLQDGDTIIVPHAEARAMVVKLVHQHSKAHLLYFLEGGVPSNP